VSSTGDPTATAGRDLGPRLDPARLAVARFAAGWYPAGSVAGFSALVRDDSGTTLVCSEDGLEAIGDSSPAIAVEPGWRRITFAGPLPGELVGLLADVAGRLAGAQIPFTSMSGFTTDHALVRAAHADPAVQTLRGGPPPVQRPGTNP